MAGEGDEVAHFNTFILRLTDTAMQHYGWRSADNDTLHSDKVRSRVCELRVAAGDTSLQQDLIRHYSSSRTKTTNPDMLLASYQAVIAVGKQDDITSLMTLHNSTYDSHLRTIIARAFATGRDKKRLREFLSWFTKPDFIKPQDLPWWYGSMMYNPVSRDMTWNWLIEQWDWLTNTYHNDNTLDKFITMSARVMATGEWLDRYNEFVESSGGTTSQRNIDIGRDEITARIAWLKRSGNDIKQFIALSTRDTIGS